MQTRQDTAEMTAMDWTVEGMTCAGCVNKITGALKDMPGVAELNVSMMREQLSLQLDVTRTAPEQIERSVGKLGFTIHRLSGEEAHSEPKEKNWYQDGKIRLVGMTGLLLILAWGSSWFLPGNYGYWAFVGACLMGLAPLARTAISAARNGSPFTIEMLMTISATGAIFIGAAEEAALVVFLFAIGEVLEGLAANRARAGIRALGNLVPKTALLLIDGEPLEIAAKDVEIGQQILIRPGDRVPADGEILSGQSGLDESPVTGESIPVSKGPGDAVFAGSVNSEAALTVTVTRAAKDNTIARIIRMVEEAESARAPTERFIDRFSRYYMPCIVGLSLLVAILPPMVGGEDWQTWIYRALTLLLIGCPCALVISVPASIASALSSGTKQGLLLKGGAVIEQAAAIDLIAFDKTGTLTNGRPVMTDMACLRGARDTFLGLAAGIESQSSHPLAQAVVEKAYDLGIDFQKPGEVKNIAGKGLSASLDGREVWAGSPRLAAELDILDEGLQQKIEELEQEGKTLILIFDREAVIGWMAFRDEPRADAIETIRSLQKAGVSSLMLTGDNERTAAAIAGELGMDHKAGLLPDDKLALVREISGTQKVMMVGDGINDAPALAAAHVGIAMGGGTDVALETGDGALMKNRLADVAGLIQLSRAAMLNIRQNIALALGLKAVFLVTSILGITGLWIAILADTGATVLVTLNAIRLLRYRVVSS